MLAKPLWLLSVIFLVSFAKPETAGKEKIQWLTLEEATEKMKTDPRPMIIDLYAKWYVIAGNSIEPK